MSSSKTLIWKSLITFLTPVIILLIPCNEVFTYQMKMATAFTLCFLVWLAVELTDFAIPALLWPAALILSGAVPAATVYSSYLGTTFFGIAAALVWANVIERTNLFRRIAFMIAGKTGNSYLGAAFGIFLAGLFLSLLTFCNCCLVIAVICASFVRAMKLEDTECAPVIMMTGMLAASTVRMCLYYPLMQGCIMSSVSAVNPNFSLTFIDLFIYNWPVLIFCVLFMLLMVKMTQKHWTLGGASKEYFKGELKNMGPMSNAEKYATVSLLFVMIWIVTTPITGLDTMIGFIVGMAILFVPGIGIGTAEDIKGVSLSTLLFFASCMAIGAVCAATGITALLTTWLSGIFSGIGVVPALVLLLFAGFMMNFAMTPVAMLAGFTGMFYSIFASIGIDPMAAVFTFNHSTDLVLFPYEFLTFLLFFSVGCINMKQFVKYHALKTATYFLFFVVVFIPYWKLVGLI